MLFANPGRCPKWKKITKDKDTSTVSSLSDQSNSLTKETFINHFLLYVIIWFCSESEK